MKHYSFGDNRKCLKKTYDKSHMKVEHQIWFWYAVFIKQGLILDLWNKSCALQTWSCYALSINNGRIGQRTFLKGNLKLGPSNKVLICCAY